MSVNLGEGDEEPLETDIDNAGGIEPVQATGVDEQQSDATEGAETAQHTSDETQLAGMLVVVWVLIIIGIVIFIASTIVKKRADAQVQIQYVNVASGMYTMSELSAEEQNWTDYFTVTKKVQTNGNTVAFYLSGEADNYGQVVYLPVSQEEFNSVRDGDTVEFVFARLNIEGKENILIRRWNLSDNKKK